MSGEAGVPSINGDVLMRIRSVMPRLSPATLAVARQVLDDPAVVPAMPISELATHAGASQASVTRFCQAIGLSGYPDLRLRLAAELAQSEPSSWRRDVGSDIDAADPPEQVPVVLASSAVLALQQTLEQLDVKAVQEAADLVTLARRIDVYGVGGGALVAQELQLRLHRIGRPAWCFSDAHAALMSAALQREGDVFFAISRSGRTVEVLDAMVEARSHGAATIALTSFPRSPLAAAADVVLTTHVQDEASRHGSLSARHAQLLVVDCVYSAVAQRTFAEATEALALTTRALASHRSRVPHQRQRPSGQQTPDKGA
jgi:DNA-binding MurR/RpiR family transcriptional regulator